jgi:hypothetical protein
MWTVRDRTKALRLEERVYITPPPLPRLLLTVKEVQKTKKNSFVLNIKQHNKHITKKMFLSLAYYKNLFFKNSDTFRLNKNKLIISPSKPNAATSFNTSTHILYEFWIENKMYTGLQPNKKIKRRISIRLVRRISRW